MYLLNINKWINLHVLDLRNDCMLCMRVTFQVIFTQSQSFLFTKSSPSTCSNQFFYTSPFCGASVSFAVFHPLFSDLHDSRV